MKNLGIAGNRNTGFEKARGKYLAILDSDDMWIDPEKLEKQVSFLEKNPEYGLIGTWAKKVDGNGKDIGNMSFFADDKNIRKHILRRHQFVDSSSVFSRQAAMDIEGYDSSYAIAGDYNFMLAIGKKYKFANIPEYMTAYRIRGTNTSKLKRAKACPRTSRDHQKIPARLSRVLECFGEKLFAYSSCLSLGIDKVYRQILYVLKIHSIDFKTTEWAFGLCVPLDSVRFFFFLDVHYTRKIRVWTLFNGQLSLIFMT